MTRKVISTFRAELGGDYLLNNIITNCNFKKRDEKCISDGHVSNAGLFAFNG
jgi:hypothetical protein